MTRPLHRCYACDRPVAKPWRCPGCHALVRLACIDDHRCTRPQFKKEKP